MSISVSLHVHPYTVSPSGKKIRNLLPNFCLPHNESLLLLSILNVDKRGSQIHLRQTSGLATQIYIGYYLKSVFSMSLHFNIMSDPDGDYNFLMPSYLICLDESLTCADELEHLRCRQIITDLSSIIFLPLGYSYSGYYLSQNGAVLKFLQNKTKNMN